jgi:hypothetical protein
MRERRKEWETESRKLTAIDKLASILPTVNDCCSTCCEVDIVDLPSGGGGTGINFYDTVEILRQESRATVLVDDMPAIVYDRPNQGATNSGFYFFDAASLDVDDGISIVKPNSIDAADPGRWLKWKG